jgi:hypothetical protein
MFWRLPINSRIMTEKELISKLQSLKQVKPRTEWVILSKNSIFENSPIVKHETHFAQVFSNISSIFFQKKLIYSFAALLIMIAGSLGVIKYEASQIDVVARNSTANLLAVKSNMEVFKAKSQALSQIPESSSLAFSSASEEVKDAAKSLVDTIQKNPELAKTIALDVNNSKTLLNIPGGGEGNDLREALNTPYKALVEQLIKDQKEVTLNSDEQMVLDSVIELHDQGRDSDALVNLILLVKSIDNKQEDVKDKGN